MEESKKTKSKEQTHRNLSTESGNHFKITKKIPSINMFS